MVRRGGSPARAAAIVLGYALAHSLLASRPVKGAARRVLGADGEMLGCGPFRYTRHPANWGPLVVVLLFPRMTVNRATLAVLSAAYLVLGSIHEEYRLLAAHRLPYERYRARAPFLLGSTRKSSQAESW